MPKSLKEKKEEIIKTATRLFVDIGIERISIKDIALNSNVGEATIYRYFIKKENLVIATAIYLEERILRNYFKFQKKSNGLESIKSFYDIYLNLFNTHLDYYKFLFEFDLYLLNHEDLELQTYEDNLDKFKEYYLKLINLGIKDKSIKKDLDYETFFYTSTHSLLSLAKKLSLDKALIKQDENKDKSKEVECLIETFINYIKN